MTRAILTGMLLLLATGVWAGDTISIRGDAWAPYNGDPASDRPGFMIEAAKIIFAKAGYTVDYQTEGWAWERCIEEATKGKIDAIVGALKDDAPDLIFPTEALGLSHNVFFVKKANPWRWKDITSLSGIKLGVISGYAYHKDVDDYIQKNKEGDTAVQAVSDDQGLDLNIKKLEAGRIDALIEDEAVFWTKVKELGMDGKFELAGGPAAGPNNLVFIAFSPARKTSAKYAQMLSEGIRSMRESGALKTLLDAYAMEDWQDVIKK